MSSRFEKLKKKADAFIKAHDLIGDKDLSLIKGEICEIIDLLEKYGSHWQRQWVDIELDNLDSLIKEVELDCYE